MNLLKSYNIPTPNGAIATTPEEAEYIAEQVLNTEDVVVKAQVVLEDEGEGVGSWLGRLGRGVFVKESDGEVERGLNGGIQMACG
jgi:succinyl-CoA synthetase beta subunit